MYVGLLSPTQTFAKNLTPINSLLTFEHNKPTDKQTVLDEIKNLKDFGCNVKIHDDGSNTIYEIEITDKNILKTSGNDNLISSTLTYIIPKTEIKKQSNILESSILKDLDAVTRATAAPELRNWTYVGNSFYEPSDGTPYKIEGPANFSLSATTTSHWEINGSIAYNVKQVVEGKIGGSAGQENKRTWSINIDIPNGYYRKIEVWEYLTKYAFDTYLGNFFISSGTAYKPNGGLKITNNLYKK